jgi:hypothetical protein
MLARLKSRFGKVDAKASKPDFSVPHGETATPPREPTPLPHAEPPASAFPLDCLTPKLRSAAEAIVSKTQGPAALAAQSVLSVASLVAGTPPIRKEDFSGP